MDTQSLLKSLKDHKVKFVIIGATAFPVHGYSRATLDIDIFIKPEKSNAEKTIKALSDFGYDVSDVTIDELLTKKILIRQSLIETDIHPHVKGISFNEVWRNKVKAKFENTFVDARGTKVLNILVMPDLIQAGIQDLINNSENQKNK